MANSTNKIENIQLYVRVRPINAREREVVQVPSPKEVVVTQVLESKILKKFTFDRAFGPDSRQADVYYTVVAPLVEEVLSGYNCTVFAYGQTGTGKTHTMIGTEGPELKSSREEDSMVGIIPRAWSHLFDELRTMDVEFSMRISYLELYNEEFCDLLSSEDTKKIRIFDDANKKGSVIIQGLEKIPVHSKDDVYKLLEKGKERRKTAATLMNAQSSRSHTVFTILLHIKESGIDGEEMLKIGKLNLVDLAGSENISKAGNEKGIRTRETFNINQSLLALGRVITALVERTPHVPYRESKLTRLLQESLGGRAKTSIIATVSPGHKDLEETLNTLYYAYRAKNIKNRPELNMKLTKKTVLKQYNDKIDQLNRDLMAARGKNGIYLAEETYNDLNCKLDSQNKELNEKMLLVKALKDDLASKERIFNEVSRHFSEKSEQLKRNEKHLTHAISKLEEKKTELQKTTKVLTTIKRHYKEKKHLLGTHVETEKHLTNQAIQLIEVVEVATADTHMLHNTIERRKSNDVEIKSACEVFVSKMEETFDIMNKNLENLQKEHNSLSEIIMEEIGKNSMEHKNFSSVAINKVKSISEKHVESMNDIHRYLQKYGSQFTDGNSDHEREFFQLLNGLKQNEMDFKFTFEKHFAELLQLFNQQSLIVTNNSSNVAELIVKNYQTVTEFAKSTTSRLNDFTKSAKSTLENDVATIGNCIEARKNISSRRQALLNSFNRDCRSLDQEENVLDEKLQTVSYNARELNNKIDENAGCEIKALQELNANLQDAFIELKSSVLNLKNETHDSIGKRTNRVSHVNEILVKHLNSKEATVLNLEQMTECHSTELIALFDRFKTETMAKEEPIRVQIDTDCNHVSELINMDTERAEQYQTQSRALNESLQSSIKEYTTQYHDNIAECKDQLQNFQSNELKTYTPTGQTPSRKDFSYPRVLVATSPHSNVIRRFRMDREWSDSDTTVTINDDSENPLHDFSADELGISWTPNPKVNDTVEVDANNNGVITLKELHAEFNCKIPTLLSMIDDQS